MRTTLTAALLLIAFPLSQDPETIQTDKTTIGKPAPTLRLNNHDGNAVTIGGETDHWTVLAFYPKAATPG